MVGREHINVVFDYGNRPRRVRDLDSELCFRGLPKLDKDTRASVRSTSHTLIVLPAVTRSMRRTLGCTSRGTDPIEILTSARWRLALGRQSIRRFFSRALSAPPSSLQKRRFLAAVALAASPPPRRLRRQTPPRASHPMFKGSGTIEAIF